MDADRSIVRQMGALIRQLAGACEQARELLRSKAARSPGSAEAHAYATLDDACAAANRWALATGAPPPENVAAPPAAACIAQTGSTLPAKLQ